MGAGGFEAGRPPGAVTQRVATSNPCVPTNARDSTDGMVVNGVMFPDARIAPFCREHAIASLSLFGGILRDDFGPGATWMCWWSSRPRRGPRSSMWPGCTVSRGRFSGVASI